MCELACQAYDFMEEGRNIEERCYRFPFWVGEFFHPCTKPSS